MDERDVPGFEGEYLVSDSGIVSSVPRARTKGGILKQHIDDRGYPTVEIGGRTRTVHSLVLTAFVGPRPAGMECRHLNGVHADPRLVNLQWGTKAENFQDSVDHGTRPGRSK